MYCVSRRAKGAHIGLPFRSFEPSWRLYKRMKILDKYLLVRPDAAGRAAVLAMPNIQ